MAKITKLSEKQFKKICEDTESFVSKKFSLIKKIGEHASGGYAFNLIGGILFELKMDNMCIHSMKDLLNDAFEQHINIEEKILKDAKKKKAIN
jgi:hypothetical protein